MFDNQKGSSLLEVLAVLMIVILLGTSVLRLIGNTYSMFKQSMATSEIKDLQKAISGSYDFSGDYDSFFQEDIYKILCEQDKSAPNQMCVKSGSSYKLRHRLSGDVTVEKSSDSKGYKIVFRDLTLKNCINLTQIEWTDRRKIKIYQIDVNDNPIVYFPARDGKSFPITIKEASSACNKKNDENTIAWYFY